MKSLNDVINEAINKKLSKAALTKSIKQFLKTNNSQFENFRKELFKYGYGLVSLSFNTEVEDIKLIFRGTLIDNYFAHQPNEYVITVCIGSMSAPDTEILRIKARNGLTQQMLLDATEKFLIEEFGK